MRRWWIDRLAGDPNPPLFTWAELSTWRWGINPTDDQIDFKPPRIVQDEPERPDDQIPAPPAAIEPSPVSAPSASDSTNPPRSPRTSTFPPLIATGDSPPSAAGSSRLLPIDACKPMNYCGR